ncbi:MAG: NAD(P)/FAD-dependent oxidoreductase [Thiotrichales bacterium]|nr:MAG: NAD(P)/FAD-dependent oxidoreductase [Thiotrichales bacterium]
MDINVIVLGDGIGGIVTANLLRKKAQRDRLSLNIRLVGNSPVHTYQPGMLFLPFRKPGYRDLSDIQKATQQFIAPGVEYVCETIEAIDTDQRTVTTNEQTLRYDWLVVALGCRTLVDSIDGLREQWGKTAQGFYTPDSAMQLAVALENFEGGNLLIDVAETPIKCPVAPVEFAFLADEYLRKRGIRNKTRITYVTPMGGAFTRPVCDRFLTYLLKEKDIYITTDSYLSSVTDKTISCANGRDLEYDLLVVIPPHEGSDLIEDAGLGDGLGYGRTDKQTLKSVKAERVFFVGDNSNVPTSKAGSVAHFQAEVVVHNLLLEIAGKDAEAYADGHANCFIETGNSKAVLVDFNYDIQPLPGKFPLPVIGPMSLLTETRLNHLGKLAFKHVYWNLLLPARPIPLVGTRMKMTGKDRHALDIT